VALLRPPRTGALALWVASLCLLGMSPNFLRAAEPYSEDALKAAYLYRFAGYIEWPTPVSSSSIFTIAVLGDEGVAAQLERLLPGHLIKGRPAQVRVIRRLRDLENVQVLYVGRGYLGNVRMALESIGARPILTVTDDDRGLDEGSVINFVESEQRVRFEVSLTAAARSHLMISSELLAVAARVQGGRLRSEASCPPTAVAAWSDPRCTRRVARR